MMEKVAEIIAWLAMTDAATATTNIGQYILPASSYNKSEDGICVIIKDSRFYISLILFALRDWTWDGFVESVSNQVVVLAKKRGLAGVS